MKSSLIIFGVIFLVLGVYLYYVPVQNVSAETTTGADGTLSERTSSASVTVPQMWAFVSGTIGLILLILGLVSPGPVRNVQGPRGPRGRSAARRRRSAPRRRGAALPRGTSVTTTTRIKR